MMENEIIIPEEVKKEVSTLEEWTKSVSISNPIQRVEVFNAVQSVKAKKKAIVDFFAESKAAAAAAHKAICANEKSFTDKLDAFERAGKAAILSYDRAEEEKRLAEQRRLQAIADEQARKEREKAEAEARRQREIEEAARRKAEEARQAAEAANEAERAKLLKEAEAAERKAAAAQAKAEEKAETAAAVVAPVIQVAQAAKQAGESYREVWKWKVVEMAKVPDNYKILNETMLNKFAVATKGAVPVPGIEFYSERTLAVRV